MALCSKEAGRIVLWIIWVTVWLLTSIYVALAVITFGRLGQAATELHYIKNIADARDTGEAKVWRAPIASLVISALLVFGFNFMSCITLIKKSINRGGPGFGYGFMMAFSFALSFLLLLTGLILDGFRDEVKTRLEQKKDATGAIIQGVKSWNNYATETFIGTEVMALLSFCIYFLFGFVLIILQAAISEHLGIQRSGGKGGAASAVANPAELEGLKDGPAAPADYEQYAQQYEQQYGGYGGADGSQYSYSTQGYQAPVAPEGGDNGGYYTTAPGGYAAPVAGGYGAPVAGAADYQTTEYQTAGVSAAPPVYAQTGYAAVNAFNTYSTAAAAPVGQNAGQQFQGQQV